MLPIYSYIYSLPYVAMVSILFLLKAYGRKSFKLALYFTVGVLLLFIGLRGHIYTDYTNYYPFFQELPPIWDLSLTGLYNEEFESGFIIYTSLIKTIVPNYFFWVFINCLIDLSVLYWFFKRYSANPILSFILFACILGVVIEGNLYRNSKSMMLFLLSIPYLHDRKFCLYIFINFIGSFFHISSLLYIPLYFVLDRRFSVKVLWVLFALVNTLFLLKIGIAEVVFHQISVWFGIDRIVSKILAYTASAENYGLTFGYIERTFAFILFLVFYDRLQIQNSINRIFCNCFFIYYLLFYLFTDIAVITERIPLLFVFSYWVLYPNVLPLLNVRNRHMLSGFLVVFCFLKIATANADIMAMYDNLLFGIRSYEYRMSIFDRYYEG